jgi:hypothetical protein
LFADLVPLRRGVAADGARRIVQRAEAPAKQDGITCQSHEQALRSPKSLLLRWRERPQ